MRSEKEICTLCYGIQDACNFLPVCRELVKTIEDLQKLGFDRHVVRTHPAVIVLVDKINDMIARPDSGKVLDAMGFCRVMKVEKKVEQSPIIEVG